MEISPQLCRAARALLGWTEPVLARAAGLRAATVRKFEAGGLVRKSSVLAMQDALEGAGLELIGQGEISTGGGEGVRIRPTEEPEVAAAKEAVDMVAEA